jgi:D-lactate dehydrogenase
VGRPQRCAPPHRLTGQTDGLSDQVIRDDVFSRLLTFPNVVVTGHQAFFTREALTHIAETTLGNITAVESGQGHVHTVGPELVT